MCEGDRSSFLIEAPEEGEQLGPGRLQPPSTISSVTVPAFLGSGPLLSWQEFGNRRRGGWCYGWRLDQALLVVNLVTKA